MSRARALQLIDVLVVVALAVSALVQVWSAPATALEGGRAVHLLLATAVTIPLLMRRRHAVEVFLVVFSAAWIQGELGGNLGQPWLAVLIAIYAVGAHETMPLSLMGPLSVVLLIALVDVPRLRDGERWDDLVPAWFVLVGTWAFGRWIRHRARDTAALTERMQQTERDAENQAQRAVTEERARIARELHDLVAHSMGVIVIQAQGAQRSLDGHPDAARNALKSIESASRSGLEEMRRLLGLLSGPADGATTAPQPDLAALDGLVEGVRSAGLPVRLSVEGDVRRLPPGVELAAYRIVQEAMTNALKHSGAANLDVRIRYSRTCLEILVDDDGSSAMPSGAGSSSGHGLVGMKERVSLYGGTVQAGPRPGGGFGVHARIPVGEASA